MPGSDLYKSPANAFLREEVYKLGSSRGIRSMPPGPRRDFLVLTWGPVVYVTSYPTKSKPLLHSLIRCLNDAVRTSIHRNLSGSDDLLHRLEVSYMVKVFDAKDVYDGMDVDSVRNAFRDFKMSLALPTTDLPGRMRSCLMVDEEVLAKSAKALGKHKIKGRTPDPAQVWVKVVEDNFPDGRFREQPFVTSAPGAEDTFAHYRGSTMIAVSALVEVFDGLRQGKYLAEYHRRGQVYIGEGNWRDL